MARKRMLSPEMYTSGTVATWPIPTRWTWGGLLCYLDDYGYGEDSPALVKAAIWPRDDTYTARKVAADLERITASGTLCRFVCCGRELMHAPGWDDWQNVPHAAKFRLCPCPLHDRPAHEEHTKSSRDSHEVLSLGLKGVKGNEKGLRPGDDCEHGIDRHASCPDCPSSLRVVRS